MPGKSRSRKCPITFSSGSSRPPSPTGKKRGRPSGTLTRAKRSSPDLGVAREHAEAERKAGDVREGLTGADAEGRQHREDLALEALLERPRARPDREPRCCATTIPSSASAGPSAFFHSFAWRCGQLERRTRGSSASAARGVSPSRRANGKPSRRLAHQAGDADHEELVQVGRDEATHPHPLEHREGVVGGEVEQPGVVLQRRQLAIQQPPAGCLARCRRGHRSSMSLLRLPAGYRVVNF